MEQVLKVANVTQRFGGLTALENVSMEVAAGEIIGVIGPNGAGKTTLFNCITGIYKPTEGTVELAGRNITGWKPYQITKQGFARTFQNIRLFKKMTVLDNVIVGMHTRTRSNLFDAVFCTSHKRLEMMEAQKKAEELLKLFNLYEHRYDMATSLPYGQQRELEIVRAMAAEPKLLLLDEPAAGMNEQETQTLMERVGLLKKMGYTILLIEHDMRFVMNICERLYVLDNGRLIGQGTPQEVKKNPVVIEAYLGKDEE
jgi:branched-chain amino acid transport system ATP-binding protein